MIRRLLLAALAVSVVAFGYYLYEREKELRLAEERAKAAGELLLEGPAELPVQAP